jgi:hypothetical protein
VIRSTIALRSALATLVMVAATACGSGPAAVHQPVGPRAETVRAQFNRDVAHTRVVILAAPT